MLVVLSRVGRTLPRLLAILPDGVRSRARFVGDGERSTEELWSYPRCEAWDQIMPRRPPSNLAERDEC
ncbi:hypothetical protein GCM10023317_36250 [Actinopolymorpha pittospori]